ncbi:unnamed protein product (macronuclear) [Paramecium tetraurelia]|uniref:Response regulatory domain-containing protein n=1 Tax=Paramecium tetraurelia TaxID=5888 RepID=A0DSE2_PARTE|nr:uncharacterized protein GSPATT00019663001 [Paramecium tetraurelia]CAK85959.1 unnamed protein product [Paramecium tetraurelia]|eukprot:XP_001453356.1 hypothetical protein (macronuclear) [Paramecium tetraurelia strain d4-2]
MAFNHLKYSKTHSLVDFSIKTYIKYDTLNLQILLSPLVHKQKLYQILFVSDVTNELEISQILDNNKNSDDYLISDISQRIRQPLNSTISMLEIIMNTIPEDTREKYINPALAGCKLLINTANDILDYVQLLKRTKLELTLIDIQMHTFISDILNVVKSQATFRGLKLIVTIEQKVPQFIRTDPNRLRQVLIDLLVTVIQATIKGKIILLVRKCSLNSDHVDIIIKVNALETNFQILKMINKTVRFFKSQSLQSKVIELSKLKQYSQSMLIAFYLTKYLSSIPFEYDYERVENLESLQFIIKVQNLNTQFNELLSQKRLSVIQNQKTFHQLFVNKEGLQRGQSDLPVSNDLLECKQIKKNVYIGIKEKLIESDQNESDVQEYDAISIESRIGLSIKVDQMEQAEPYFFDYINEDKKRQELFISQPSQQLTFGGFAQPRSSIYSSLGYSSGSMQPNDLLDCFEKMEKLKQQKFQFNCQCPKILIYESIDLDLYAMSHQLDNLGILYEYITQRQMIVSALNKNVSRVQHCCKGLELLFIGVEQNEEDLASIFAEIKEIYVKFRVEPKIIALMGDMHQENRKEIMKLPFHDFLSKPIMIDALLFILTKWIKIQ